MASSTRLLYVCVQDTESGVQSMEALKGTKYYHKDGHTSGARYTRPILQSTLQLMGCKTRHAHKISERVFEMLDEFVSSKIGGGDGRADISSSKYLSSDYHQEQGKKIDTVAALRTGERQPVKFPVSIPMSGDCRVPQRDDAIPENGAVTSDTDSGTWEQHLLSPLTCSMQTSRVENGEESGMHRTALQQKKGASQPPSRCKLCGGVCLPGLRDVKSCREKGGRRHKKGASEVISVNRRMFLDAVCAALAEYHYVGPNQRSDLELACRIREKKTSVTILLCGTSGCGKSTLASLLASRLGITTVVSTDSVRHMMRSFVNAKECPLLYASTYHAGDCLDPEAIAAAKARKRPTASGQGINATSITAEKRSKEKDKEEVNGEEIAGVSAKCRTVKGFKAQSEMVMDNLDRLISVWEARKESVIVEGVHLSLNFVMMLMKKHPTIIPFMVFIANEAKHLERFAVRAKYMALDPARNKYVKYIRNIRIIQEYLVHAAEKHQVPKINNTNVDKSVAAIHATVFSCLRRREVRGEPLYDPTSQTVWPIHEEYKAQTAINTLSSKGMFQLIQQEGSSRSVIQHISTSGRITGTWSVPAADNLPTTNNRDGGGSHWWETEANNGGNGKSAVASSKGSSGSGSPWASPNAESTLGSPVNLRFGSYGLSAWATNDFLNSGNGAPALGDVAGTSYGSSITIEEDIPSTSYKGPNSLGGESSHMQLANSKHAAGEASLTREYGASTGNGQGLESPHLKPGDYWDDGSGPGLPDKQLNQAVSVSESDEEEDMVELGESDDGAPGLNQRLMDEEEVGSVDESEIFMHSEEDRMSSEDHDLEPELFDDMDYTSEDFDSVADGLPGHEEQHLGAGAAAHGNTVVMGSRQEMKGPDEGSLSPKARHRTGPDARARMHAAKSAAFYGSRKAGARSRPHRSLFDNSGSPLHADRRSGSHLDSLKEGDDEKDTDADVDEVGGSSLRAQVSGSYKGSPSDHVGGVEALPSGIVDSLASAPGGETKAVGDSDKDMTQDVLGGKSTALATILGSTPQKHVVGKGEEGGG